MSNMQSPQSSSCPTYERWLMYLFSSEVREWYVMFGTIGCVMSPLLQSLVQDPLGGPGSKLTFIARASVQYFVIVEPLNPQSCGPSTITFQVPSPGALSCACHAG